jgi:uncharacterized protein (DUF1810 family)
MVDPYRLQRFLAAQEPVYATVVAELSAGRKRSHWMWFIFPQVAGLGSSPTAVFFAISSLDEARAYLNHLTLGPRLCQSAALMLAAQTASATDILGPIDAAKFRSSMTLFEAASPQEPTFAACLHKFFAGERDRATLERI